MKNVLEWLGVNWWWLVIVATVLINICNAVTAHWSEKKGLVRVMLFIVDLLSIVKTGGAKLPLLPSSGAKALLPFALVSSLILGASGCCSTPRCYLKTALEATAVGDKAALPALEKYFKPKIDATCPKPVQTTCPAYQDAKKAILLYQTNADVITDGLKKNHRQLEELGVK